MYISKEVRDLLQNKMNFREDQVRIADENLTLSARILGLVQIIKSEVVNRKEKLEALNELQGIRAKISGKDISTRAIISKAYDEYYSYRNYKNSALGLSF